MTAVLALAPRTAAERTLPRTQRERVLQAARPALAAAPRPAGARPALLLASVNAKCTRSRAMPCRSGSRASIARWRAVTFSPQAPARASRSSAVSA
jgi:hypothetical protein